MFPAVPLLPVAGSSRDNEAAGASRLQPPPDAAGSAAGQHADGQPAIVAFRRRPESAADPAAQDPATPSAGLPVQGSDRDGMPSQGPGYRGPRYQGFPPRYEPGPELAPSAAAIRPETRPDHGSYADAPAPDQVSEPAQVSRFGRARRAAPQGGREAADWPHGAHAADTAV
jgi:hypothetical protein